MREARNGDDTRIGALERGGGGAHPARLHAIEPDIPGTDDRRTGADVGFGRFRLQDRMVDEACELGAIHGALRADSPRARAMRALSDWSRSPACATSGVVSGTPK